MAKKNKDVVNSYVEVMCALSRKIGKTIEPKDLFEAGLDQIKLINDANNEWKSLVENVFDTNSTKEVYVRSHGRNGGGSDKLCDVLEYVFGRTFSIDKSNNAEPKRILKRAFNDIDCQDYQISHIFEERTNNPLLFGAPWMICYTPKIIDPFTGHESQGFPMFREAFVNKVYSHNEAFINEYNKIVREKCWPKLKEYFESGLFADDTNFKNHMIVTLAPIEVNIEKLPKAERINRYLEAFNK